MENRYLDNTIHKNIVFSSLTHEQELVQGNTCTDHLLVVPHLLLTYVNFWIANSYRSLYMLRYFCARTVYLVAGFCCCIPQGLDSDATCC